MSDHRLEHIAKLRNSVEDPTDTLAILRGLKELYSVPGTWTLTANARDEKQAKVDVGVPSAVCFCLSGGMMLLTGRRYRQRRVLEALKALVAANGSEADFGPDYLLGRIQNRNDGFILGDAPEASPEEFEEGRKQALAWVDRAIGYVEAKQ